MDQLNAHAAASNGTSGLSNGAPTAQNAAASQLKAETNGNQAISAGKLTLFRTKGVA